MLYWTFSTCRIEKQKKKRRQQKKDMVEWNEMEQNKCKIKLRHSSSGDVKKDDQPASESLEKMRGGKEKEKEGKIDRDKKRRNGF